MCLLEDVDAIFGISAQLLRLDDVFAPYILGGPGSVEAFIGFELGGFEGGLCFLVSGFDFLLSACFDLPAFEDLHRILGEGVADGCVDGWEGQGFGGEAE